MANHPNRKRRTRLLTFDGRFASVATIEADGVTERHTTPLQVGRVARWDRSPMGSVEITAMPRHGGTIVFETPGKLAKSLRAKLVSQDEYDAAIAAARNTST